MLEPFMLQIRKVNGPVALASMGDATSPSGKVRGGFTSMKSHWAASIPATD